MVSIMLGTEKWPRAGGEGDDRAHANQNSKFQTKSQSPHAPPVPRRSTNSTRKRAERMLRMLKRATSPAFFPHFVSQTPPLLAPTPTPHPRFSAKTPCAPPPKQNKPELHFRFIKQLLSPTNRNCTSGLFSASSALPLGFQKCSHAISVTPASVPNGCRKNRPAPCPISIVGYNGSHDGLAQPYPRHASRAS
jgi:hypothetical protein